MVWVPVHGFRSPGHGDEPVAFDRGLPGDCFLGVGDLGIDTVQGPAGPVCPVLVIDGPTPGVGLRAHQHGLGRDRAIGWLGIGIGRHPFVDRVGNIW